LIADMALVVPGTIAEIEAKREKEKQGGTVDTKYPLEHEYDAAYKEAVDKLKAE
jgi:hypothetical protein